MGEGNNTRARTLNSRLKQQVAAFKKMANEIHHGSKEDLIAGIAESASKKPVNSDWDGFLSAQDLLLIAKRGNDPKKKKSLYEILTNEYSAKESHFSTMEIICIQDNCSMTQLFCDLRRKLPGYFASERETDKLKSRCKSEFAVMLEPTETKTGYKINPN